MNRYDPRRGGLIIAAMLFIAVPAAVTANGDEDAIVTDEEALFGESAETDEAAFDTASSDTASGTTGPSAGEIGSSDSLVKRVDASSGLESNLLLSERVEIGGRYGFSARAAWRWDDPESLIEELRAPDGDSASIELGTTLFLDARPTEDFRVFAKGTLSFPFDDEGGTRSFDEVFRVEELFSDFHWNDTLFFRGGRHTANWGVGYFFSPADLLNVTGIDPEDPEAEREGPVSLRAQLPIEAHNFYLYLIANRIQRWDEIGVAAKAELVIGAAELGIGALVKRDSAPAAMVTATLPLGDLDLFGEGVLRYGADRRFVEVAGEAPFGVAAVEYDDRLFPSVTAGISYRRSFEALDASLGLVGQYLYHGEGYADPAFLSAHKPGVAMLLASGELSPSDLVQTGRHYAAVSASFAGLLGGDLAFQIFWIHNFSDMSGYLSPSITYAPIDAMRFTLQTPLSFGEAGDEYASTGRTLSVGLAASIGGGRF